ncbi:hypothetical protein HYT00_00395 [Candidatus Giovannonibacteria bacterium]|nr:hypothetical protein [Candidatus Giovannonibacteria bacterium]
MTKNIFVLLSIFFTFISYIYPFAIEIYSFSEIFFIFLPIISSIFLGISFVKKENIGLQAIGTFLWMILVWGIVNSLVTFFNQVLDMYSWVYTIGISYDNFSGASGVRVG